MIHKGLPPKSRSSRRPLATLLLPLAALGALAACSSKDWAPPPSQTRDDARNVKLVGDLLDVMEEREVYVLELEDQGVRVLLDRREGGAGGPVYVAPTNPGVAPGPGGSGTEGSGGGNSTRSTTVAKRATDEAGPGKAPVDQFHPDNQPDASGVRPPQPKPVYGGKVTVHLSSLPKHMNYVTENSAVTRRMLYEVHEFLAHQDWESHELVPRVADRWKVEDIAILKPGVESKYPAARALRVRPLGYEEAFDGYVLFGATEVAADGSVRVTPTTEGGSAMRSSVDVPASDLLAVEEGCSMTFHLRNDVLWHPASGTAKGKPYSIEGQRVDARDVYFSWELYGNPEVDCDEKRFQFEKVTDCEIVDDLTVRFFYQEQYFQALESIGTSLTLLPSHIYDLTDPDCPWYDPDATQSARAKQINENPHNQMWVGVGPYRVTSWTQEAVEAERFDDYFDPENSGYVDTIRWRYIGDDGTAMTALLNGELDFFERVKSADYFGAATEKPEFTKTLYKGYKYLGTYGYTGWNTHRPYLSDKRVRQAFAHAFPFDDYLRTNYKNLARQITGPFPYSSAAYDHSVEPFPYDLDRAKELLEEAGFYDTDGNGIVDKDGRDLEIGFMMPSGNDASTSLGLVMQDNFAKIGVKVDLVQFEWATFLERMKKRDFDGCNLAWVPPLESDPEQVWHSKWGADDVESSNNSGLQDPHLDELILAGQRELDFDARQEIWKEIHRYLYDLQPYLFGYNVPQKFAIAKKIRGFQAFAIDPGYSIRRWYFTSLDEPGTRATRAR
ncbi:MAG: ABC transporter substrate-binding protein [Planctomycetota bacterium]